MRSIIYCIIGALIPTVYILQDHEDRLRKLENAGQVEVFLDPIPKLEKPITTEYKGPKLYNSHTKIVFHDKREFQCLAENIYRESRGEPLIGKISVAMTVLNRAESGKWGYSFCSVVYAPHQYSWTSMKHLKPPHGPAWESSKNAARLFVNGVRVETLNFSDHYHTRETNTKWDDHMRKTATIGNHVFYAQK